MGASVLFVVRIREVVRYLEVPNVLFLSGGRGFVHCTEVVRFSESQLLEVPLPFGEPY